ncbi:MAG: glycosyltransferase [Flavobacterium sp.]|nr:glycosyltransferase [Flavobacterium sp.]
MATYNRAHFIMETLIAVQQQTYANWECLIIDDGGNDNTQAVIKDLLLSDQRFYLLKRPENYAKGLPGCRNFGLDTATGDYIIFFDDDDIPHPQNLELCVKELAVPDVDFCRYERDAFFGKFEKVFDFSKNYNKFYITDADIEKIVLHELPINSCAVMWKKSCFDNARFVEHLMYAEEWELYSRIIATGLNGISIEKTLFFGRKHDASNTGEFYKHNLIRKKSNSDAIVLVIENLRKKGKISHFVLRHFVVQSYHYKEFRLFQQIMDASGLTWCKKMEWEIFFKSLPIQFGISRLKKRILKR